MAAKCKKCGKATYFFLLNNGLCNPCITEQLEQLEAENKRLRTFAEEILSNAIDSLVSAYDGDITWKEAAQIAAGAALKEAKTWDKDCFTPSGGIICIELEADNERKTEALERIQRWAKAYPLSVFPEPDFVAVRKALKEYGISLDAVSASNMRHVIKGVSDIVEKGLKG